MNQSNKKLPMENIASYGSRTHLYGPKSNMLRQRTQADDQWLMHDEMTKCNLHEVGFQTTS